MLVQKSDIENEFLRVGVARIPVMKEYGEPSWNTRTVKVF